MNALLKDLRYAVRNLQRSPVFTFVAIFSLALGIGANAAIFSLLDQMILRPLDVKNPHQLVALKMEGDHYGSNWGFNAISYPMYKDFREHNEVFSDMFCRFAYPASLGYGSRTERVNLELVSGTYFPLLGINSAVGRLISPSDDLLPGAHPVLVLSYAFWKTRFGGDRSIVGHELVVNGRKMTVIGVAQRNFDGIQMEYQTQVWVPVMMKAQITPYWDGLKERRQRWVNVFGRLKPGVSIAQAQASLQPFMHHMLQMEVTEAAFSHASAYTRQQFLRCWIHVLPGERGYSFIRDDLSTPVWMLLCIAGGVLLIACTNLASLLLARATTRQREVAVRLAIGASRWQIVRQLLMESFLLSIAGTIAGLAISFAIIKLLLGEFLHVEAVGTSFQPKLSALPDERILLFTFAVAVATTLLFGLLPALRASRPDLAPTLKDEAGSVVGGTHMRVRKALVSFQVALSLLLLIGAGLFIRTLSNLRQLGPGFPIDHLVAFEVDPSLSGYSATQAKTFYRRVIDEMATLPAVQSVGLAGVRILEGNEWDSSMTAEGYQAKPGKNPQPYMNMISPGYFKTLGVPILEGRDFTFADTAEVKHGLKDDDWNPSRAIVNEAFAKKYFAGRNPIGMHVGFGADPGTKTDMEIVGVVKDIKYTNLRDEIPPQAFIPYMASRQVGGMTVYMRSSGDPAAIGPAIQQRMRSIDRNLPLFGLRTTEEQIEQSLRSERFVASLSSAFGLTATLLAVIGLYGVMAFTVSRRTREIGVRMALGAIPANVIWMVMREVLLLIGAGVAFGVPAAIIMTRFARTLLYGLAPGDPSTVIGATVLAVLISCLAGWLPAWRASQVSPISALRYE